MLQGLHGLSVFYRRLCYDGLLYVFGEVFLCLLYEVGFVGVGVLRFVLVVLSFGFGLGLMDCKWCLWGVVIVR